MLSVSWTLYFPMLSPAWFIALCTILNRAVKVYGSWPSWLLKQRWGRIP